MSKIILAALCLAAAAAAPVSAANLVQNGGFEITTAGPGEFDYNTSAANWTSNGYNFIFGAGTADTTGSYTARFGGYLQLWGPNNGSANGLTAASPTGGNFAGADGAFITAPIEQKITGLTAGQKYVVAFDWAAAQQFGYTGDTTENWTVSLGSESYTTSTFNNPSHGFSGWMHQSFTFTATSGSEVLSFLAHGTPDGLPPFSLLDGVSLNAAGGVPEASTWGMMLAGFGMIGFAARRRSATAVTA